MILSDFHVHTTYCDGKDSPEDIVREAIRLGMRRLGFSGHSYTPFDPEPCMSPEDTRRYIDEVHRLKAKYSGGESVETVFSIEGTQTTQTARRGQSGIWLILMLLALLGCLIAAYFLTFGSGKGRRWRRPLLRRGGAHKGGDTNI